MDNVIKLPTRDAWQNVVEIWDGYRLNLDPANAGYLCSQALVYPRSKPSSTFER